VKFKPNSEKDGIRLNKYIANAGICSRREADELITAGVIKVNGVVVTTLGSKVMPEDKVQYGDQSISNEKKRYLLLNKQKGYVTTTKDPHAKNTVMELIEGACRERIYPVGRLDRNTTGLLLFTNDGDLAKKLMHPSSRIRKMYHVVLDQPVSKADMLKIAEGIALDDDRVQVDGIAYVEDAKDRREIGLELHSGQNRVVRRIFESLGYKVTKLDRVVYAGLTKKGIPRGKWRFLSDQEVIRLKMLR
jgi:23S rRNA pseudouridine2605 synthase